MHRRIVPIVFVYLMLLNGCGMRPLTTSVPGATDDAARQTEAQQHIQTSLDEAEALLRSGDNTQARGILAAIDTPLLSPGQQARFALLHAQIDLSSGDPEKALQSLDTIAAQNLSPEERKTYHESRAFAYSLSDRPLDVVRERIALAPLLMNAEQRSENQKAIFEALNQLPPSALQHPQRDELGGWMALTLLLKRYPQGSAGLDAALRQWQSTYPQHPADLKLLSHYSVNAPGTFYPLRNIAVLLPASGNFAPAAEAVKAGFLAAEKANRGDKPKIRFYDSEAALPGALYQQAVADGADLVVGPLEKDKLKQLAATQLTVPVLALNDAPGVSAPNLYKFALNPSDEAEQAAFKAISAGYHRAAILVPNTDIGKRTAQGFSEAWRNNGGVILKTVYFDAQSSDFTQALGKLLNFDESASRFRQVSEIVPALQFKPRRRGDIEVIFINADPAAARALNRQIRALQLDGVAVYATPHLYSNNPDPAQDESLDGITFCDIPWFFPSAYHDDIDAVALQAPWKQMQSIYLRLLAMGIDAYNLTGRLQQLDKDEYAGATGNLLRLPDGRIRRNLFCARFSNGIPEPLGFASAPPANNAHSNTAHVEDASRTAIP